MMLEIVSLSSVTVGIGSAADRGAKPPFFPERHRPFSHFSLLYLPGGLELLSR